MWQAPRRPGIVSAVRVAMDAHNSSRYYSADTAKTYTPRSAEGTLIYNPHRFPSLGESGPATIAMKAPNMTPTWQKVDGAVM